MSYKSKKTKKIHRRGPSVFHKSNRKVLLKNVGMFVLALMIIPAGFFVTKFMMESGNNPDESSSTNMSDSSVTQSTAETDITEPTTKTTDTKSQPSDTSSGLRAFYIPSAKLNDTAALDVQLNNASAAGLNAVVFDLKGEDGTLHYKSATELAQKSKANASDAMTLDSLKTVIQHIKDKGFVAIPRIYAFKDPIAPFNLPSAKITLQDYPGYTWLDNSKSKGGKPWLNPYAADAHRYIIDIAKELVDNGCTAIMFDGVQFPNQTSKAYYGTSELTSLSKFDVLQKFVKDLCVSVGEGCNVIQAMPGLSAFGNGTKPFGGNPVTFGANTVAPVLMPSKLGNKLSAGETTLTEPASNPYESVKLAVGQVSLRLNLINENNRPGLMPWLQAYDYTSEQILQQINAVTEKFGSDASYLVFNPEGRYDFISLKK